MGLRAKIQGLGQIETSKEEVQNLAKQRGLPATPVSAVGTALIGGNLDQQKMAGTPAQKDASLEQSTDRMKSLQQVQRTSQVQAATPTDEVKRRAENLEKLGSLGSRVQDLISHNVFASQEGGKASLQVKPDLDLDQFSETSSWDDGKKAQLKQQLQDYAANPTSENLLKINQALGRTQSNLLSAQDLGAFYVSGAEGVGATLAALTPDTLKMTPDNLAKMNLGMSGAELASLLNLTEDELATKSIADVQALVEQEQGRDFSQVAELQSKLVDPNVGDAEKDQIRARLAELSAGGVSGLEADVGTATAQIKEADKVSVGGETFDLQELLSDKGVAELVERYLSNDPLTAEFRATLEKESPELAAWIKENASTIKAQMGAVEGGVEQFAKIQEENQALASTPTGQRLSDDVMKAIFPDWGSLSSSIYDKSAAPFLEVINDPANPAPQKLTDALNDMAKTNPEVLKEMSELSADELKELGMDNPNSPKWSEFLKYKKDSAQLAKIPDNDLDALLDFTFGQEVSKSEVDQQVQNAVNLQKISGKSDKALSPMLSLLDSDQDGRVDNPATLKQALSSFMQSGASSLRDLLAGKEAKGAEGLANSDSLRQFSPANLDASAGKLAGVVAHMKDGVFVGMPAKHYANFSYGDLQKLWNNFASDPTISMSPEAKATVKDQMRKKGEQEIVDSFGKQWKNAMDVVAQVKSEGWANVPSDNLFMLSDLVKKLDKFKGNDIKGDVAKSLQNQLKSAIQKFNELETYGF